MARGAKYIANEFLLHLPYSVFSTAAGLALAGTMLYVGMVATGPRHLEAAPPRHAATRAQDEAHAGGAHEHEGPAQHAHAHGLMPGGEIIRSASSIMFHVFHPIHMLFSAVATTAMFWRHEKRLLKAIVTGFVGALGICSISDVALPYLSGLLLGAKMQAHWCLLQHPMTVVPFAAVGVIVGLLAATSIQRSTYYSHTGHVFVSSAASILYLVSFGMVDWVHDVGYVFILMLVAVMLPCCVSDIVFPLLVARKDGLPPVVGHAHH